MNNLLMNCWYMGAWAEEVQEVPLSRVLLNTGILFYRNSEGTVAALRDRCPHRFAPLSKGKVVGDVIQCPYHGLMFDSTGQCVSAPLEEKAPRAVRVQSFPVVERDNIIWFWPGEPAAADPTQIPDFSYMKDPAYKYVSGMTHINAHYELETDNLMDLSHVEMLHPAFAGVLSPRSKFQTTRMGNQIQANWFSSSVSNPPAMEHSSFPTNGGLIDQWLEMRWSPPGAMHLEIAVTRAGETRDAGYTMPSTHILTPETANTTLYFWAAALHAEEQMPMDQFREMFVHTFEFEDKPMIEQVAAAMGEQTDLLAMKPLLLRSDAGSVLARRVMVELIEKEVRAKAFETAAE